VTPSLFRRAARDAVLLTSIIAASAALTACAGTAPPPDDRATAGAGERWSACMRGKGYDVEDVTDRQAESGLSKVPSGADEAAFSEAAGACSTAVGIPRADEAQLREWDRQYEAADACIRERGYPDFPGQHGSGRFDREDEPEFTEVASACLREFAPDVQQITVPPPGD